MRAPLIVLTSLTIATLWGAGCGSEEAPAQPKVQVVSGHAKAAPGEFEQKAFPCCADPSADAVVRAFSDMGAKLAADDEAGAKAAAASLATAMDGASFAGDTAALASMAGSFRDASSIVDLRDAYLQSSVPMLAFAKAHKGGSASYVVAYCPMKPGRWLQSAPELANPYYGAEMLRCGTFEAVQ